MADLMTAFWGMTINNYDETDLAMVQNGYPDHMRELVYTLEQGEDGTPHVQAYLKLKRQQRLSFVKKLFPRGHFVALTSGVYIENTKRYAQKLDQTARSPAVHKFYDPVHTIEGLVRKVIIKAIEEYPDVEDLDDARRSVERDLVIEDYSMAKVFVSATYKQMWKQFGHQMYQSVHEGYQQKLLDDQQKSCESSAHTHTHTHAEKLISRQGSITSDASPSEDEQEQEGSDASGTSGSVTEQDGEDSEAGFFDDQGSAGDCSEDDWPRGRDQVRFQLRC